MIAPTFSKANIIKWMTIISLPLTALVLTISCQTKQPEESSKNTSTTQTTKSSSLPVIKEAPTFSGTNRTGNTFASSSLRGSVWLAYFFFSSCGGPCPALNKRVSELHQEFLDPALKFVGISVDPDTDMPQVLERYARHFFSVMKITDTPRWYMLQMPIDSVKKVAINGFLLPQGSMDNAQDDPNLHSTRLVLIDKQGNIRGYFDGLDTTNHTSLSAALKELLAE